MPTTRAKAKATKAPSGKENASVPKTVKEKLAQAKLNRELAKSRYPLTSQPLPEEPAEECTVFIPKGGGAHLQEAPA